MSCGEEELDQGDKGILGHRERGNETFSGGRKEDEGAGEQRERERERELSLQRWYSAELVYPVKIQSFRLGR